MDTIIEWLKIDDDDGDVLACFITCCCCCCCCHVECLYIFFSAFYIATAAASNDDDDDVNFIFSYHRHHHFHIWRRRRRHRINNRITGLTHKKLHRKKVDLEKFFCFVFFLQYFCHWERERKKNPILAWWSLSSANATATTTFKQEREIKRGCTKHTHKYIDFFLRPRNFILFCFFSEVLKLKPKKIMREKNRI